MLWNAALMLWIDTNQNLISIRLHFKIISIRLHFKSDGIELSEPETKNIPLLKIEHEYFPDSFFQPLLVSAITLKSTLEITKTLLRLQNSFFLYKQYIHKITETYKM